MTLRTDDELQRRLARMAHAAGFALVDLQEHRRHVQAQDAMTAVAIQQARLMRAALVEIRAALESGLTAHTWDPLGSALAAEAGKAVRIVAEALDPVPFRVVEPGPEVRTDLERPPLDIVREDRP